MGLAWLLTLTKCHVCTPDVLRQVVYSYLFGIIFFSEHLSLFGVLGTLLIAAGMALVTARSAAIQPSEKTDTARSIAAAGIGSKIFQRSSSNSSPRTWSYQRLVGVENTSAAAPADTELLGVASSCQTAESPRAGDGNIHLICDDDAALDVTGSMELVEGNTAVVGDGLSVGVVGAGSATALWLPADAGNTPTASVAKLQHDQQHLQQVHIGSNQHEYQQQQNQPQHRQLQSQQCQQVHQNQQQQLPHSAAAAAAAAEQQSQLQEQ
jgi:hypothetical protein